MGRLRSLSITLVLTLLVPVASRAQNETGPSVPGATALPAEASGPSGPASETQPSPPEASQLAQRLEETSAELRDLHARLGEDPGLDQIAKRLTAVVSRLAEVQGHESDVFEPGAGWSTLRDLKNEWKEAREQLSDWSETLTATAAQLDEMLATLRELSDEWSRVRERAEEDELPELVIQRIDTTLSTLAATEDEVRTRRANVLELQNSVSEELVDVGSVLDLVDQARARQNERLLTTDRPPLWAVLGDLSIDTPLWRQILASWTDDGRIVAAYAVDHWEPFAWQLLLFAALASLFASLHRQSRGTSFQDPGLAATARVLRRPYSAAFLVALLASPWIHPVAPNSLMEIVSLAAVLPVLRLLPQEFRERGHASVPAAVTLYLFQILAGHVDRSSEVFRVLVLIEACAGVGILLAFLRPTPGEHSGSAWTFLMRIGRRATLVGLSVAIAANVLGNVRLAEFLTTAFLNAAFIAAILYAVVRVLDGVVTMLPRTGALATIDLVRGNAAMLARRGIGLVRLLALFTWAGFVVRLFRIREQVIGGLQTLMAASWALGSVEVSAGSIVTFVLAATITVATARSLQLILRNEVLPRLDLPRGVPGAISAATQYVVLSVGFLVSLAIAGVDLGSLALVAGGLGVGIGFGLQNVVNNFVSGLILLFERPVRDGDFVQTATTFGEVKRIGFRSSTIRTWEGSEVILPNSELVASTVTNWTLADNHRCMAIDVRAAYGSDPEKVIGLLIDTAKAHPKTFDDPAPHVFLMAFGESGLEFSLRFWTRFEVGLSTRSEVAIEVEKALRQAGLAAPVPHRVVHLEPA